MVTLEKQHSIPLYNDRHLTVIQLVPLTKKLSITSSDDFEFKTQQIAWSCSRIGKRSCSLLRVYFEDLISPITTRKAFLCFVDIVNELGSFRLQTIRLKNKERGIAVVLDGDCSCICIIRWPREGRREEAWTCNDHNSQPQLV